MDIRLNRIGIIGKGKMGSEIFYHLLPYDFSIVWICRKSEDIEKLNKEVEKYLRKLLNRGYITEDEYAHKIQSVSISNDYKELSNCDLIIESIVENETIKKNLFLKLDHIVRTDCILTSNTSSIPLNTIFEKCKNPSRCFGLHFFFPLKLIQTVELNKTEFSDQKYSEALLKFLSDIGKKPMVFETNDNFILYRIYILLLSKGYDIYQEKKLTIIEIDQCIKERLFPFGLFNVIDSIGLEICIKSLTNFLEDRYESLFIPLLNKLKLLLRERDMGGGGKDGLIAYEMTHFNKNSLTELKEIDSYKDYIVTKLVCVLINELAYYIQKGVSTEENIGKAIQEILGMMHDPFTMASQIGYDVIIERLSEYYFETGHLIYKPIDFFSNHL